MSELDELDREEFYRLKKVQGKKQEASELAEKERLALKAKQLEAEKDQPEKHERDESRSTEIFKDAEADEDVIFN